MKSVRWIAILWAAIVICGCNKPNDDDNVKPVDPEDKAGNVTFVIVDDFMSRTPENSALINDNQYWQTLQANGFKRKLFASTNPAAKQYLEKAEKEKFQIPGLFVVNEKTNKWLVTEKLTTKERVSQIAQHYYPKSARGPPVEIYIEPETGKLRKLGVVPPTEELKALREKSPTLLSALKAQGLDLVPKDQWKDVEYPQFRQPIWVLDQHSSSGCVGYSCAAAHMKKRELDGHPYVKLSGSFTYSNINGGRDSGAMILDSMYSGMKHGFADNKYMDFPKIFSSQVSPECRADAATRKMMVAYPINTEAEMATALQLGLIVQAGVQVDGAFGSFDSEGISRASGRYANHSIHIYGMKKINGEFVYEMGNTWGATWGPKRNGSCFLRNRGVILQGDAFVHVDSEWNPNSIPTPKRPRQIDFEEGSIHVPQVDTRFVLAQ